MEVRMSRFRFGVRIPFLVASFTAAALAQTPPSAPPGAVIGVGNFIHVVSNLDKSIEFYHDVLGLELNGQPGPRAYAPNALVSVLYHAPGAQMRIGALR